MHLASPASRENTAWRIARASLSVLVAGGFLALAMRKVDARQMREVVRHADFALLALAAVIGSANLLLRAARWRVLLSAAGSIPLRLTFWVTTVGYLGNLIMPMRAGDLGRSLLMGQRAGMGGTFALATTVAERVLDLGFLVFVGGMSLLAHPLVPDWLSRGLVILAGASTLGLVALLGMPGIWAPLASRLERSPHLSPTVRWARERWLDRFFEGMASVRSVGRMAQFLGLTCALWFVDAVTIVLVAGALRVTVPIHGAIVLLSALGASSVIPITPGQIGVFQWVASSVLGSYGVPPEPAVLTSIGLQAVNYAIVLAWGTAGFIRLGWPAGMRQPGGGGPSTDMPTDDQHLGRTERTGEPHA